MSSEKFESFYKNIYPERWEKLRGSLHLQSHVAYTLEDWQTPISDLRKHSRGEQPTRMENGLLKEYFLDPASVMVARSLPLENAERVLDMCAAPGGKSLVIFSRLRQISPNAEFVANEISNGRRENLTKVIQNYIPKDERQNLWVKGSDGVRYGLTQPESFDGILLDAPCSGEGHLLENQKELDNWSPQRTKGLAIKQYSLLSSAWSALKPGGFIMYSTCSVSPLENDGVIEKLLKKKKDHVQIVEVSTEIPSEKTKYGFQFFPDQFGFGPLYGCLVRKAGP